MVTRVRQLIWSSIIIMSTTMSEGIANHTQYFLFLLQQNFDRKKSSFPRSSLQQTRLNGHLGRCSNTSLYCILFGLTNYSLQVNVCQSSSFQSYSPICWGGQILSFLLSFAISDFQPGVLGILSNLGHLELKSFIICGGCRLVSDYKIAMAYHVSDQAKLFENITLIFKQPLSQDWF